LLINRYLLHPKRTIFSYLISDIGKNEINKAVFN